MKHVFVGENLSEECKKDIEESLSYLNSEARKNYSSQRIQNDVGNYKISAAGGAKILRKHGAKLLNSISELRKEEIRKVREEINPNFV